MIANFLTEVGFFMRRIDLTGEQFGKLTVLEIKEKLPKSILVWKCLCDCGNIVNVRGYSLKNGHTKSCGCIVRELNIIGRRTSHRMHGTHIYWVWHNMKTRCNNPKSLNYSYYGGRGIMYDERWEKFENFYEDMKDGYVSNLSIDRIDNNKGYYKENCKWSTAKEQANNRRNNL